MNTLFTIIMAVGKYGAIGINNMLPWSMPEELQHYKSVTSGKIVIVGRKTYQSLPPAALRGRRYLVLTTGEVSVRDEDMVCSSWKEALLLASKESNGEVMIAGGASLYKEAIHFADNAVVSVVDTDREGDTYFDVRAFDCWGLKRLQGISCQQSGLYADVYHYTTKVKASTPCVGICSCSLGDDICRGCGREARVVTEWNSYPPALKRLLNKEAKHERV